MLQIQRKHADSLPLEVAGITPCQLKTLSLKEIEQLPILHGNQQLPLAELFRVSGEPADETIEWSGDLNGVHWLGAQQQSGNTRIAGNAGRHVGSEMRGGSIEIEGNAGDWLGAELHGGTIRVRGHAGDFVGSAYRGAAKGMTGGTILIHGNAGQEIGHAMRRGLIAVGGRAGNFIGFHMLAGTIVVCGESGIRHGADMKRGTLLFLGPTPVLLPTFQLACRYSPEMLRLLEQSLRQQDFPLPHSFSTLPIDLYHGDLLAGGRGEILLGSEA